MPAIALVGAYMAGTAAIGTMATVGIGALATISASTMLVGAVVAAAGAVKHITDGKDIFDKNFANSEGGKWAATGGTMMAIGGIGNMLAGPQGVSGQVDTTPAEDLGSQGVVSNSQEVAQTATPLQSSQAPATGGPTAATPNQMPSAATDVAKTAAGTPAAEKGMLSSFWDSLTNPSGYTQEQIMAETDPAKREMMLKSNMVSAQHSQNKVGLLNTGTQFAGSIFSGMSAEEQAKYIAEQQALAREKERGWQVQDNNLRYAPKYTTALR